MFCFCCSFSSMLKTFAEVVMQCENQGADGLTLRAQEPGAWTSAGRRSCLPQAESKCILPLPFCSTGASYGWAEACPPGEACLYPVYWCKCSSPPETPSETLPETTLYQLCGHPLVLKWNLKLSVTFQLSYEKWPLRSNEENHVWKESFLKLTK